MKEERAKGLMRNGNGRVIDHENEYESFGETQMRRW